MNSLKTLHSYLFEYKKLFIIGLLFIFLSNFFSTYSIIYIGHAVDFIEKKLKTSSKIIFFSLFKESFYIIFFGFIAGVFKFYMRQTIIVISRKIEKKIKDDIYNHYQQLSDNFYKQNQIGDLMNRITEDVSAIRMHIGPGIMYRIDLLCKFICVLCFLMHINPYLTLFSLIPFPFLSIIIYFISNKINLKSKKLQKNQSDISSFVQDSFSGIRVIKSFAKEEKIISDYQLIIKKYKYNAIDLAYTEALFFPLMLSIIGLSNILILYIGGVLCINNKVTTGDIANFFVYINLLTWPFASLGWVTSIKERANVSMMRIQEFLNTKNEILELGHLPFNFKKIEFKNVSYIYPNTGILALKKINFTIYRNQSTSIMGKTGSGKTTLMLLLLRLIDPTQGEILIDGININLYSINSIREKISMVPQDSFLFSDSVQENILVGNINASYEDMIDSAKQACIHNLIQSLEHKYQTKIGERGITLSGGQKQRIAIARAIIKKPKMLILDDSLSSVDTETEKIIFSNLKNNIFKNTSIIITHRISTTKNTDNIIILDHGEIIQQGNHNQLINNNIFYKKLYYKQIKKDNNHLSEKK